MPRGVRLNPKHDERTRAKIQTSQLINRLMEHVNGTIEMTTTQVRAAEILLRKTLPDLQTIAHQGQPNGSIEQCITVRFIEPDDSAPVAG